MREERAKIFEWTAEKDIPAIGFGGVDWDEFDYLVGILTKYVSCELIESVDSFWDVFTRRLKLHGMEFMMIWDEMLGAYAYAVDYHNPDVNFLLHALLQTGVDIFNSRKYFRDSE